MALNGIFCDLSYSQPNRKNEDLECKILQTKDLCWNFTFDMLG